MSTPAPTPTCDRKTRATNVDQRLGLPDVPKKRRSPAEKKADEQKLADLRAAKEATVAQAIQKMGELENEMAGDQAAAIAVAKPIRPRAKTKNGPKAMEGEYII